MTDSGRQATLRPGLTVGRFALAGAWLVICAGGVLGAFLWPDAAQSILVQTGSDVRDGGLSGVAVSGVVFIVIATTGALPASLVGVAAGALYGTAGGFALAAACTLASAVLSFALSRSVLRPAISAWVARRARWKRLDARVAADSWRLVCLLRVSPIMPFSATSFALGLSSIAPVPYLAGTLAAFPALFGFVALGAAAGGVGIAGSEGFNSLQVALLAIGGVATILLSARLGRYLLESGQPAEVPPQLSIDGRSAATQVSTREMSHGR